MRPVWLAFTAVLVFTAQFSRAGIRSHVLIGVVPDEMWQVTANAWEIPASPAVSDSNGILVFEFDDAGLAPGPITMRVCRTTTGIEILTMMEPIEKAIEWAWCLAPVWPKWGVW